MKRYFRSVESFSTPTSNNDPPKQSHLEVDLPDLPSDLGLRPPITDYEPNIQEQVHRAYLLKGPCQPRNHKFPQRDFSGSLRRFTPPWFEEGESWMEYSISQDAIFCLCCYLFKPEIGDQGGGDSFVGQDFKNWKKMDRLKKHEGGINSAHNRASKKCLDLLNQKQHIETIITKQSDEAKRDYRVRLTASINCIKFLLRQGLPFRGHDESELSSNQGNFLELLKFLVEHNEVVRAVALKNAPENLKLTSPDIRKDICNAIAVETTNAIIIELGDGLFSILLDESRDVSMKEQMAVALKYIDKRALVAVAKKHIHISNLFTLISNIFNVVGASCKRCDTFRDKRAERIFEALSNDEILSGRGLNQESTLVRASDTRWGSHHGTLLSLLHMFSTVIDVLDVIVQDGNSEQKSDAFRLLKEMQSFEFAFSLHLMSSILGITNELSQALQRKDQDIVNAMRLVQVCKDRLQLMRDSGWDSLMEEVATFCDANSIDVPSMDGTYICQGRSRRRAQATTNLHHYHFELLNTVVDRQLQELNSRFNEVNTELLLCVACLHPSDSFTSFDKKRLVRLAEFYPKDLSDIELWALPNQLENFIRDVRSSEGVFGFERT
ncbi:hypothetical protein RHMOL_Rhmol04G0177600 [Rhododendron molle]|uniref:Uncharacterized protein n=1 Tax=Rhododendron molle TaxID=49168 RepID=A0ACC0P2U1_RHOML|nr:hypothetical protein RHMOL_Rhmol04G0177600 [Rhododendron molle]